MALFIGVSVCVGLYYQCTTLHAEVFPKERQKHVKLAQPKEQSYKSHNALIPFRPEMCSGLFWKVHCGIWDKWIVGFVKLVYLISYLRMARKRQTVAINTISPNLSKIVKNKTKQKIGRPCILFLSTNPSETMTPSSKGNLFRVTGLCAGNSPVTQRPVTRSFDVSLICAWINEWVNNREAGDLRRHCAHFDVTAMFYTCHGSHIKCIFLLDIFVLLFKFHRN